MKTKIIAIGLISFLLVACDNSEMEYKQRGIANHALGALSTLKPYVVEYYSKNNKCLNDILSFVHEGYYSFDMLEDLSISEVPNGCQVKATFKESIYTPDLSKESLSIRMQAREGNFYWTCASTIENKKYAPPHCN